MRESNMQRLFICLDFCVFCFMVILNESYGVDPWYEYCVPKTCGHGGPNISFPFHFPGYNESYCGSPGFELTNCNKLNGPSVKLGGNEYVIQNISYQDQSLRVHDSSLSSVSTSKHCFSGLKTMSHLQNNYFDFAPNMSWLRLFYNCSRVSISRDLLERMLACDANGSDNWVLPLYETDGNSTIAGKHCTKNVRVPVERRIDGKMGMEDLTDVLKGGFVLKWTASDCNECEHSGGRCGVNRTNLHFKCYCRDRPHSRSCKHAKSRSTFILATVISGVGIIFLVSLLICVIIWQRKARIERANLFSRSISKPDMEGGGTYFGIPVFSYIELKVATDNFDSSNELGDGGFGTVYHGKLKDGREVAVKRLYEHNSRRIEQYMNEIKILTSLRHRNLVSLYGCTSSRSKELLLVYEYVANGTVAGHLHGERAQKVPLTWPVRMKIAIETADALAYLHKSDIIHRDVKTDNILLDQTFCVKVADFGLSRLFPTDVTHVSTAPQGTPGYVDPEYHQCYQLTDKSDVYSFGVVLMELVSSMPAVDISRDRHEINLANLAVNKIQMHAFDDLIDSTLGYNSDAEITRMTVSVAELAFQCLQLEKDLRPSMDKVLDTLREIQGDDESSFKKVKQNLNHSLVTGKIPNSPETDDIVLLKNKKFQSSPNAVTDVWLSSSTPSSVG